MTWFFRTTLDKFLDFFITFWFQCPRLLGPIETLIAADNRPPIQASVLTPCYSIALLMTLSMQTCYYYALAVSINKQYNDNKVSAKCQNKLRDRFSRKQYPLLTKTVLQFFDNDLAKVASVSDSWYKAITSLPLRVLLMDKKR